MIASNRTTCPLCAATDLRRLAVIDPALLRRTYREELRVEIELPDVARIEYLSCGQCDLRFFSPAIAGDAPFYRQLQSIPWYYRDEKAEYTIAARHVAPHDHVLEIGAGKGAFSRQIRCASYTGLEMSPDAIEIARRAGVTLLSDDLHAHGAAHPARYDVVCAFQVLEHVPDPLGFLRSAVGCLRPQGKLIMATPSEDSFASVDFWDVLNMPPHHVTRWTDRCFRNAARLLDLSCVAIEHEPLPDRDVRWCARLIAQYGLARRLGRTPTLLDPYVRRWFVRRGAKVPASLLRRAFQHPALRPHGHAVVAVFQKQ